MEKPNKAEGPPVLKKLGYYHPGLKRKGMTPEELDDPDPAEVERIAAFLKHHPIHPRRIRRHPRYKNYCKLGNSYGLKHSLERLMGYSANGEFIAACMRAGFRVEPEEDSPNANVYMLREKIDRFFQYAIVV